MKFFACVIVMIFANNCEAQSHLGIKSGLTFSKQQRKNSSLNLDYTEQLHFAVFYEGLRSKYFSCIGEISYQRKGFDYNIETTTEAEPDGTGDFIEIGNKFTYLSLAFLAKMRYPIWKVIPYLCAGPRVDTEISKRNPLPYLFDSKQSKKILYGYSVGLGIEIPNILSKTMLLEAVVSPDLSDIYRTPSNVKNRSIQTAVGIVF